MKVITNQNIVAINIQKIKPTITQKSLSQVEGGGTSQKISGRPQQVTGNIDSNIKGKFKSSFSCWTSCGTYSKVVETHIRYYYRYYKQLEEILLSLKMLFTPKIMQKFAVYYPEEEV